MINFLYSELKPFLQETYRYKKLYTENFLTELLSVSKLSIENISMKKLSI